MRGEMHTLSENEFQFLVGVISGFSLYMCLFFLLDCFKSDARYVEQVVTGHVVSGNGASVLRNDERHGTEALGLLPLSPDALWGSAGVRNAAAGDAKTGSRGRALESTEDLGAPQGGVRQEGAEASRDAPRALV